MLIKLHHSFFCYINASYKVSYFLLTSNKIKLIFFLGDTDDINLLVYSAFTKLDVIWLMFYATDCVPLLINVISLKSLCVLFSFEEQMIVHVRQHFISLGEKINTHKYMLSCRSFLFLLHITKWKFKHSTMVHFEYSGTMV